VSVQRVTITAADEKYEPPGQEIEVAVIGNDVLLTVYDGSSDDLAKGRTKVYDVPPIALHDLIRALNAFSDVSQGVRKEQT
jgi:hypothetical protein